MYGSLYSFLSLASPFTRTHTQDIYHIYVHSLRVLASKTHKMNVNEEGRAKKWSLTPINIRIRMSAFHVIIIVVAVVVVTVIVSSPIHSKYKTHMILIHFIWYADARSLSLPQQTRLFSTYHILFEKQKQRKYIIFCIIPFAVIPYSWWIFLPSLVITYSIYWTVHILFLS